LSSFLAAVAVLGLLTTIHEVGHLLVAQGTGLPVEEFGLGYPPRLLTLARRNGTNYSLNCIPFGAFLRLADRGEPSALFSERSVRVRLAFLIGGPLCNWLLAIALFAVCFATGWPMAHDLAVGVNKVLPGSVAQAVGFEDDDLILAADGCEVSSVLDLILYARSVKGDLRTVTIRRHGQRQSLPLPAGGAWFVKTETRGVQLHDTAGWEEFVAYPWPTAITKAVHEATAVVSFLFTLPIDILRGLIPIDMVRPVGPVGIAQWTEQATRQAVASGGWFPILQLTATLSAALATTNLLPLPGLDGGRLLFVIIEILRGNRLDPHKENLVHFAGILLMLMLILVVTYHDISTPASLNGP